MAGKGDKPRNCFSKKFKKNYDEIDWNREAPEFNELEQPWLFEGKKNKKNKKFPKKSE
tara:strand:- start:292 stop:465 length:174 start_codon:yes stop_codon:yes gene_type:complete